MVGVVLSILVLCLSAHARNETEHREHKRKYTVGVFLRSNWSSLHRLAREISDPRSASYGEYLDQTELAQRIGLNESEAAARSLQKALLQEALADQNRPHIVAHRDAVLMSVEDFFATYELGPALTGNLSHAFPRSVHMLVTPPMPDGLCSSLGEEDCKNKKPCKWHEKKNRLQTQHHCNVTNHSNFSNCSNCSNCSNGNHSKCAGDFAGWICWREIDFPDSLRPEAQWHCFEPSDFKNVNSSNASAQDSVRLRRRKGVNMLALARKRHRDRFHAVPRSGGFALLTRMNFSADWRSFEITFVQDGLTQNRLLSRADFTPRHDYHMASVSSLKNLRHVNDIFVCFNTNDTIAHQAQGQPGCDCRNGTDHLGRECERIWALADFQSGHVLPRAVQSLDALYEDLQVLPRERGQGVQGTQAVAQFNDESFMQEDVVHLHRAYGLSHRTAVIQVHGARGKKDNSDTGGEGSLDLQTITSLAQSASTTWWGVDPFVIDGFMLAYTVDVNDHPSPPLVHSISWGDAEALYPAALVERLDYELMKFALRGLTVIVASGDNGNSAVGSDCEFVPDLVGTSEWVTSVGATMPSLDAKPYCKASEFQKHFGDCEELGQVTCSTKDGALITSSGYFSIYRRRPSYQYHAVESWRQASNCLPVSNCSLEDCPVCPVHADELNVSHDTMKLNKLMIPCQHIAPTGCSLKALLKDSRAAPDVALPGQSYPVIVNKSVMTFDGTSASAPALAALISRWNGEQLRNGRPPLGLLNPWLYQVHALHPEAFLDVVVGDTASTETQLCPFGFLASPGWDPATGLGVPRFSALRELLPKRNETCQSDTPTALLERTHEIGWRWPLAVVITTIGLGLGLVTVRRRNEVNTFHPNKLRLPLLSAS